MRDVRGWIFACCEGFLKCFLKQDFYTLLFKNILFLYLFSHTQPHYNFCYSMGNQCFFFFHNRNFEIQPKREFKSYWDFCLRISLHILGWNRFLLIQSIFWKFCPRSSLNILDYLSSHSVFIFVKYGFVKFVGNATGISVHGLTEMTFEDDGFILPLLRPPPPRCAGHRLGPRTLTSHRSGLPLILFCATLLLVVSGSWKKQKKYSEISPTILGYHIRVARRESSAVGAR